MQSTSMALVDTVQTEAGAVRGRRAAGVVSFLGVPYAAAPVGELRFAQPRAARPWAGVRDAFAVGPSAPQNPSPLVAVVGPVRFAQSEDCLTANVWTPGVRGRRPVLVWLHGGAYAAGAGGYEWYAGAKLAAAGEMVVVTLNYRLGALGFLYLAQLADGMGAGNFGLLDQIAGLRWVRDNIAQFGGDPTRITLAGQSAGALSALTMMSNPTTKNQFSKAILQSTPFGTPPIDTDTATDAADRFVRALGVAPSELRGVPVDRILAAQREVILQTARPLNLTLPFWPVVDPDLAPQNPVTSARRSPIVVLLGYTRHEGTAWTVPNESIQRADHTQGALLARNFLGEYADARYRAARLTTPDATAAEILTTLVTDHYFVRDFPDLATRDTGRTHVFQFDWHPEGNPLKACHCIELPFVFGTAQAFHEAPMLTGAANTDRLSTKVQKAWVRFVHTGHPGWPEYGGPDSIEHFT